MQVFDILHLSSVHSRIDTRIRYKQCAELSLAYPGRVGFVVQDGKGNETDISSGLVILDTGAKPKSRLSRILFGNWRMIYAALKYRAKVVHFHDPELIITGIVLKILGRNVIYDIHEDVPKQILTKSYIKSALIRLFLSRLMASIEASAVYFFDKSVVSVDSIADRFSSSKTIVVRNLPRIELMTSAPEKPNDAQKFIVSYAGSLTLIRGIFDLVKAMEKLPDHFELHLLGNWVSPEFERQCCEHPGWSKSFYNGRVPHDEVKDFMSQANLGVQITHDVPNNTGGLATKVFEYLFLSVPVLISDTPEKRKTYGTLAEYVKPNDPLAIAEAIQAIANNYNSIKNRALENRNIVIKNYSWSREAEKLLTVYKEIMC